MVKGLWLLNYVGIGYVVLFYCLFGVYFYIVKIVCGGNELRVLFVSCKGV